MSRIIAGSAGGRRLVMPSGTATRPTSDRVREGLFSAIVSWAGRAAEAPAEALRGLGFLDLYAGSGAVGLEAASRGAGPVTLVEANRRTAATVTARNVASIDPTVVLRAEPVQHVVGAAAVQSYDIVFADPPYALGTAELGAVLADVAGRGWLAADGLLVVERSERTPVPQWPEGLASWQRKYGETVLHFAAR